MLTTRVFSQEREYDTAEKLLQAHGVDVKSQNLHSALFLII
jgi:hypothetical protein